MSGPPKGLRGRRTSGVYHFQDRRTPLLDEEGIEEIQDDEHVEKMEIEDHEVDITMRGELEIDVPAANWDLLPKKPLPTVEPKPKEDFSWIDSFAKQQAQSVLLSNVRERKQPWETGPLASVFDRRAKPPMLKSPFALTNVGLMDSLSASSSIAQAPSLPSSASVFALQRIRQMRLRKTDDDIRRKSLERIATMMLLDVNATKLGRSLLSFAGTLVTEKLSTQLQTCLGPRVPERC